VNASAFSSISLADLILGLECGDKAKEQMARNFNSGMAAIDEIDSKVDRDIHEHFLAAQPGYVASSRWRIAGRDSATADRSDPGLLA
jgi:hypothetical protein